MTNDLLSLVRSYSERIKNGRKPVDIFSAFKSEAEELDDEILAKLYGATPGVDGIVGESIDCITCLLDLIMVEAPHLTNEDIIALTTKKLDKWERVYSDTKY